MRETKFILQSICFHRYDTKACTPKGAVLSQIILKLMLIDIPEFEKITLLMYTGQKIFTSDPIAAKLRIKNYPELLKQWADA